MFNTAKLPISLQNNKLVSMPTNMLIFQDSIRKIVLFLLLSAILHTLSTIKVSASDYPSKNETSSNKITLIPDDKQNNSTPKVNSIIHQRLDDPRSLEIWPNNTANDPFSHRVLYQEWQTPDPNESKDIDSQIRQRNNQAFLKWLKQLNQEKQ
ncbi:hypothetical protein [uncultured Shewanella sp.]|uniref:hypothetical protein n=1 Tax=uncultured Shewanella sp. TaxID=173975 RepID=UPI0026237823|nr:hypothetical protein [uncultured Shewanella sp.]